MKSSWQKDFFRDVALHLWWRVTSPEMTRSEVEFLQKALRVPLGGRLLDVPCGNGRHAIEFASRGYSVTGVDLSQESIQAARESNAIRCDWRVGDMLDLPWPGEFDGAYCCGNSFGYLDRSGAAEFLSAVAKALKPGRRFAIDTGMAAESILPAMLKSRWYKFGDIFMLSENRYDATESRLDIQYTFIQNGKVDTRPASCYCFTVAEIRHMHIEAGLTPIEQVSSFSGDPYQLGSPRLILVSEKKS